MAQRDAKRRGTGLASAAGKNMFMEHHLDFP